MRVNYNAPLTLNSGLCRGGVGGGGTLKGYRDLDMLIVFFPLQKPFHILHM